MERTEKAGLTSKVFFTGAIHDREVLRAWNTRADLFLFPSTYDTNGIVVREAAACGLASILIKDSCAAEGITHDRNGFVIEETPEAMAQLLMEVSKDLGHLHQVGQNAMDEIYISWEQAVRLAYDRYKEIKEMVRTGEIGVRKHQSFEYLMNSAATVLDGTHKAFVETPRTIYDGMRDNFQEFRDNVEDFGKELKFSMEDLRSEVKNNMEDLKSEMNDGFEKFKDKISDELRD